MPFLIDIACSPLVMRCSSSKHASLMSLLAMKAIMIKQCFVSVDCDNHIAVVNVDLMCMH